MKRYTSSNLLKKYVMEVDKLKREDKIDENAYYLLQRDTMALALLEEKTMGDANNFDSSVMEEIRNDIKLDMQNEIIEKYEIEKDDHTKTREELASIKEKHTKLSSNIENRATRNAKIVSNSLFTFLILLFIVANVLQFIPSLFQKFPLGRIGLIIPHVLIAFLNTFYGFNLWGFNRWTQKKIKRIMLKRIKGE